ncbi:MAG: hypothetical protein Q8P20_01130 [bacterium]|nr:hypothetical protein [bacterium]
MKKILLVDADSTIPNLALMKLSTWYKKQGHYITLYKANLPYYPNQKKRVYNVPIGFDKTYCSIIFEGNKNYIQANNINFGGSGYDLKTVLPLEIEQCLPDYSIYPENNISYGFITRGCIRKCSFCKVFEKEGDIKKVADIKDIVRHKKVKFLDNNILAYSDHREILQELIIKSIKCQFNQGLDIRLVDEENSKLLSKLNYLGEYIFAFDDWRYKDLITEKLKILLWRKPWQFKFFVYIHPDMLITDTIKRINWLKNQQCLPYIMRDISCWNNTNSEFFTDIAAYTNQVHLFKKLDFNIFLEKRHTNLNRIIKSKKIWEANL